LILFFLYPGPWLERERERERESHLKIEKKKELSVGSILAKTNHS